MKISIYGYEFHQYFKIFQYHGYNSSTVTCATKEASPTSIEDLSTEYHPPGAVSEIIKLFKKLTWFSTILLYLGTKKD